MKIKVRMKSYIFTFNSHHIKECRSNSILRGATQTVKGRKFIHIVLKNWCNLRYKRATFVESCSPHGLISLLSLMPLWCHESPKDFCKGYSCAPSLLPLSSRWSRDIFEDDALRLISGWQAGGRTRGAQSIAVFPLFYISALKPNLSILFLKIGIQWLLSR